MDIFSLSASLTLDTGDFESGLMRAQEGFRTIGTAAQSAQSSVSAASSGMASSAASIGSSMESAWESVRSSWGSAAGYFDGIASSISSSFSSLVSSMSGIGQNMWSGLKAGLDSAVSGIGAWTDGLVDKVKSGLGIHSPSTVFAQIGRNMVLGLDEGWNSASRRAQHSIEKTVSVPQATVDFASSSLGKSSAAQINTMLAGMEERGGNYNINLVVDGRTLANVVFDPLNAVSKQKGVAIGA